MKNSIKLFVAVAAMSFAASCGEDLDNSHFEGFFPEVVDPNAPIPPKSTYPKVTEDDIRVVSYNVNSSDDYASIAEVIQGLDADIVAIQESDSAEEIASAAGMNYSGANSTAIISVEESISSSSATLSADATSSVSFAEFANFVVASVQLPADESDRIAAVETINVEAAKFLKPVYLAGDFNDSDLEGAFFAEFNKEWSVVSKTDKFTYSTANPASVVDFVAIMKKYEDSVTDTNTDVVHLLQDADVENSSDHFPLFVDFKDIVFIPGITNFLEKWVYDTHSGVETSSLAIVKSTGNLVYGCDAPSKIGKPNTTMISSAGELVGECIVTAKTIRSSVAVGDDGNYYIGTYDPALVAISSSAPDAILATSEAVADSKKNLKYSAPAVDYDGSVYSPNSGRLYKLNGSTLSEVWKSDLMGSEKIWSSPLLFEDCVYVMDYIGGLYRFNKESGEKEAKYTFGTVSTTFPAVGVDGTIYLGCNDGEKGYIKAVNPSDGSEKWSVEVGIQTDNGIVLSADNLYVGDDSGKMWCLKQSDGSVVWSYDTAEGNAIQSTPAIDDLGNVYYGDKGGYFYALNSEGELAYNTQKLGNQVWSSPVIDDNGVVYILVNQNGAQSPAKIFAFTTKATGPLASSWSMMGGNAQRNGRAYSQNVD